MKEIFLTWITFQLIVIGIIGFTSVNDVHRNRFDCKVPTNISTFTATIDGIFFPLVAFTPDIPEITEYCKNKTN
jgi:hypothetical protein